MERDGDQGEERREVQRPDEDCDREPRAGYGRDSGGCPRLRPVHPDLPREPGVRTQQGRRRGEVRGDARGASREGPGGSRAQEDGAEPLKTQGEDTPPNSQGSRKSSYHPVPDKAFKDLVDLILADELLDVGAFGMEVHVDDHALNEGVVQFHDKESV